MSADILIEHCSLRISRSQGWSWGPDTRALLRSALQRLPHMLGARLAVSWPAQHDCVLAMPVRLRLSVTMNELLELATHDEAGDGQVASSLAERLDAMLLQMVERQSGAVRQHTSIDPVIPDPAPPAAAPDVHALWAGTVLTVLLGWHRQGVLHEQLLMFSEAALASWHASLVLASALPTHSVRAGAIETLVAEHAELPLPLAPGRRSALVRRIGLLVVAAGELGVPAGDPTLVAAMPRYRQLTLDASGAAPQIAPVPPLADAAVADVAAPVRPEAPARAAPRVMMTRFDVKIASALPFLLLGPLSRTGYLHTVSAVFEAAQMLPALPAFAAALARKVLAPPQRGWFRGADAVTAAAAFAGLPDAVPDALIADMARLLGPLVSPLDSLVAGVLTAGHETGKALLLHAAAQGWVLYEEEGMFPIACAARLEQLFARIAALDGDLLLVPSPAVDTGVLARLDDAGFRFVTDASPARGESWRALPAGPVRAWTNDRATAPMLLSAAALRLESSAAASAQTWQALTSERPLLAGPGAAQLEHSLALAAALGLGTIGWSLWRERESVTAILALARFSDLDARVSFRPDLVQVHLPLGRRFMDLKRAGWLDEVTGVPWLDGRPLRFVQG
jgi:hypothetical protein